MGFPMAWTDIARAEHNRDRLCFPSDLTDREWAIVGPMIPGARRGGRPRTTDMRDVMEAILFIASSGCPWRMLPGDFPPVSTVRGYFYAWRDSGLLATIVTFHLNPGTAVQHFQHVAPAGNLIIGI